VRSVVERGLRDVLHGGRPTWQRRPNRRPWFDQPDAEARAAALGADAAERDLLLRWVRDGYVVLDGVVDLADVDAMVARIDGLWDAPAPLPGLVFLDVRERPDGPSRSIPHAELLALPAPRRHAMRAASSWRLHGFHYHEAAAGRLFRSRPLKR